MYSQKLRSQILKLISQQPEQKEAQKNGYLIQSSKNPCTSKRKPSLVKQVRNSVLYQNKENFFYPHCNRRLKAIGSSKSFNNINLSNQTSERYVEPKPKRDVSLVRPTSNQRIFRVQSRTILQIFKEKEIYKEREESHIENL